MSGNGSDIDKGTGTGIGIGDDTGYGNGYNNNLDPDEVDGPGGEGTGSAAAAAAADRSAARRLREADTRPQGFLLPARGGVENSEERCRHTHLGPLRRVQTQAAVDVAFAL